MEVGVADRIQGVSCVSGSHALDDLALIFEEVRSSHQVSRSACAFSEPAAVFLDASSASPAEAAHPCHLLDPTIALRQDAPNGHAVSLRLHGCAYAGSIRVP